MIPIVLCGGESTRLWPIKKLFQLRFEKQNLLQKTLKRLQTFETPLIVSTKDLKKYVEQSLESKEKILYEPIARNTAVSIALACHSLKNKREVLVGIFPADHFIGEESKFQKLLSLGIQTAKKENQMLTFGIKASSPCQAYGYIRIKKDAVKNSPVKKAFGFIEKPNKFEAESLLKEGCLWNSGIVLSPLSLLIQLFEKHLPLLWESLSHTKDRFSLYQDLKPLSFDKALMEKMDQFLCLPLDIDWLDLGSWEKIAEKNQKFSSRLHNKAFVFQKNSKGNFVFSTKEKPIGLLDIHDSVIVQSEEGLLIASKKGIDKNIQHLYKESQKHKPNQKTNQITTLQETPQETPKETPTETPWGSYTVIKKTGFFKYKELKIKPGHKLSLQSHQKRKEHWLVIRGQAEASIKGVKKTLHCNEHLFIDQGVKHCLKNPTDQMLIVLEIQIGSYLEEDDIIRHEDDYGRI